MSTNETPAGLIAQIVGKLRIVGLAGLSDEDMRALKTAFRAWARGYDGKTDLTIEQEYAAIALYQRLGDERAANVVIKAFDRAILARTKGHEDAAQEERLALFRALGRFDLSRGLRLYTYANRDMQTRGNEARADEAKAVTGANGATGGAVEREAKRLGVDFDKDFARAAGVVAGHLGFTVFETACAAVKHRDRRADAETVRAVARLKLGAEFEEGRAYPSVVSLDAPLGDEGDLRVGDMVAAGGEGVDEQAARNEVNGRVAALVAALPAKERLVIECRFMRDLTLEETTVEFAKAFPGCSRGETPSIETVRKIEVFVRQEVLKPLIVRAGLVEPKEVAVEPKAVEQVMVPAAEEIVETVATPAEVASVVSETVAATPVSEVAPTAAPVQLGLFGDLPVQESPKAKTKAERERRKVVPLFPLFDGLPEAVREQPPKPVERKDNVVAFRRKKDDGPLPLFAWAANHADVPVVGPLDIAAVLAAVPPPEPDRRAIRAAAMALVRRASGPSERIRLIA